MTSKKTIIATAAALSALTIAIAGVQAQPSPSENGRRDRGAGMMERIDTDNSGTISYAEFAVGGDTRFTEGDTDANGLLTEQERAAHREAAKEKRDEQRAERMQERAQERQAEMLEKVDANSDGSISRTEHDAAQQAKFAELDADGNGELTAEEMRAHRKGKGRRGNRGQRAG